MNSKESFIKAAIESAKSTKINVDGKLKLKIFRGNFMEAKFKYCSWVLYFAIPPNDDKRFIDAVNQFDGKFDEKFDKFKCKELTYYLELCVILTNDNLLPFALATEYKRFLDEIFDNLEILLYLSKSVGFYDLFIEKFKRLLILKKYENIEFIQYRDYLNDPDAKENIEKLNEIYDNKINWHAESIKERIKKCKTFNFRVYLDRFSTEYRFLYKAAFYSRTIANLIFAEPIKDLDYIIGRGEIHSLFILSKLEKASCKYNLLKNKNHDHIEFIAKLKKCYEYLPEDIIKLLDINISIVLSNL
jgi:hypothetical protein